MEKKIVFITGKDFMKNHLITKQSVNESRNSDVKLKITKWKS